ncbi:MAG: glycine dehydrogenase, partial [Acholeplasmataceae bacterium]|nr:glycine dehydrogenase [Acholeplasmataceae bacterium]
ELEQKLLEHNILGGLVLDNNDILFCVTEKRTKEEMDYLVDIIRGDQ